MDPFTVVGFVAAVVQLIDVTSKVINYFNGVKDAPKDRAKLVREATGLLLLFTDLRCRVDETTNSTDPWFTGLQSLGEEGGPLMEFKSAMEDIADKLAPTTNVVGIKRVILHWKLDKKEIDGILSKIERLKTLISLALQKDHFKLSLAMKEEITERFQEMKINSDKLSLATKEEITMGFQEMKTSRDMLSLAIKEKITMGFQEMKTTHDAEKINLWLAAPLPSSNHNIAMSKRQPRTGEWITKSKEFADWKVEASSFIWLHGIPGCGKTILCSTIIQDVIFQYQSEPTTAVAYFYFDFNDLDKQRTEKLIRSLIVQLSAQCPHSPESLQLAYSRSQNGHNQLTIEELTVLLRQIVNCFKEIYILLDALDECTDREDLLKFIEGLVDWNIHGLHLLATSRKENAIATSLEPLVTYQLCIQSAVVDVDIRVHVLERLSNDPKLKKWPVDVRKEIEDALKKGAKGMFRWVVCRLDSLRKCLKLDALRKALNTLPKTLDETYERILSNLDEEYYEYALKIFQWLCFSMRPMRIDEMVEVLAIDSTDDFRFRPEQRLPDPCDILIICSTLVNVTATAAEDASTQSTETEELRLAHFSVKEYLISNSLRKPSIHRYHITQSSAHTSMTKTCLTYLLHFKSATLLTAEFAQEFPLIRYAAEFWPRHYRYITDDSHREIADFLGWDLVKSEDFCFVNWLRIFNPVKPGNKSNLSLETDKLLSPLYYMSYLGVGGVLKALLDKGANVNASGGRYLNALSAASYSGHEEVVRLLLERGAKVNAKGGIYGNVLSTASYAGHEGVVRLLLENGADVNAQSRFYGNALSVATWHDHEEVVRLLLEKGANVNAEGGTYGNALSTASYSGNERVVRLLLEKGANVNAKGGNYSNALSTASYGGHKGLVQLLLEKGANINAESGTYGNALSTASYCGHEEVVRFLLEEGANVNAEGGTYGNALSTASYCGHEQLVRLLLEKGANVNAEGGTYGNALSAALYSCHIGVVRLLLGKGANVNAGGGTYGNALSIASYRGHEEVVRLLLEIGANVNTEGGAYGNALSTASYYGHEEVVRLLLENGANVNAESETYGNALSIALDRGHQGVVLLLIEKGANVRVQDERHRNALLSLFVVCLIFWRCNEVNASSGSAKCPARGTNLFR